MNAARRKLATAAFAALAVIIWSVIPASAAPYPWPRTTCLTGAITGATTTEVDGRTFLTVDGWLGCAQPAGERDKFGVAQYTAGAESGTMRPEDLWPYDPVAPTNFSVGTWLGESLSLGICLVTDYSQRVACITVTRTAGHGSDSIQPISPSDPLVTKDVIIIPHQGPPNCASC